MFVYTIRKMLQSVQKFETVQRNSKGVGGDLPDVDICSQFERMRSNVDLCRTNFIKTKD